MAYNFLYQNLPNGLPSLRTLQRKVNSEYKIIDEGTLRFDDLYEYLKHQNGPLFIAIGEDARRLIARVDYDKVTDRLVGFVLPVDDKGLPQNNTYWATYLQQLKIISKLQKFQNMLFFTWHNH